MSIKKGKNKRKNVETAETEECTPDAKKPRLTNGNTEHSTEDTVEEKPSIFSGRNFRKHLSTPYALHSVKEFVSLCEGNPIGGQYVQQYLDAGGNCLELIHLLDFTEKTNIGQAASVFQAVNLVLLKVLSDSPQSIHSSEEACRYLLNNYLITIHAMLNNDATIRQRRIVLKLLTAIVSLSPTIAKEVLIHVTFQGQTLNLLTQHSGTHGLNTVRTCFIHLLIAFLVDGNSANVKLLLEKKGVLTSIIPGLFSDNVQIITLVLTTLRNHVLENPSVSKTIKMHVFNTQTVKDIVQLYNWKGREINSKNKQFQKRTFQKDIETVHSVVHDFLLVLCTSHKNGVIFQDKTMGLGEQKVNPLLYTVVDSFNNPWDHKYVSDFVIKIAVACPDLFKVIVSKVDSYLEPRQSKKWLNVMLFLKNLFNTMSSNVIETYAKELSLRQLITIVETFTVPSIVLKSFRENCITSKHIQVRYIGVDLLLCMLKSLTSYIDAIKKWDIFTSNDIKTLESAIGDHLGKYISSNTVLKAWMVGFEDKIEAEEQSELTEYFEKIDINNIYVNILEILFYYQKLRPQILDNFSFDFNEMIKNIVSLQLENEIRNKLFLKVVRLYLSIETVSFTPEKVHFDGVLQNLLKVFCCEDENQNETAGLLTKLFINTGIFEETEAEIAIWLESLLLLENSESISLLLVQSIKKVYADKSSYFDKIFEAKNVTSSSGYEIENVNLIFENLEHCTQNENRLNPVRHVLFSPLIISMLDTVSETESTTEEQKNVNRYLTDVVINLLHSQTCPFVLLHLLLQNEYSDVLTEAILKYLKSWAINEEPVFLKNVHDSKMTIDKLSKKLLSEKESVDVEKIFHLKNIDGNYEFQENSNLNGQEMNLLRMTVFYLTQFASKQMLTEEKKNKCLTVVTVLLDLIKNVKKNNSLYSDGVKMILHHPVIHQFFIPLCRKKQSNESIVTDFVVEIINNLKKYPIEEFHIFLNQFRQKLVTRIFVICKKDKFKKYMSDTEDLLTLLKTFELSSDDCNTVLKNLINSQSKENLITLNSSIAYLLERYTSTSNKPLDEELLFNLIDLNTFDEALFAYLRKYPHCIVNTGKIIFDTILNEPQVSKTSSKLASFLLESHQELREIFKEAIPSVITKKELIFPLLNTLVSVNYPENDDLYNIIFKEYEQNIIKAIEKPHKAATILSENYIAVSKLIETCLSVEFCTKFANKINKFDVVETFHLNFIDRVYTKSYSDNRSISKYVTNYIETLIHMIVQCFKKDTVSCEKIERISSLICDTLQKYKANVNGQHLYSSNLWKNFVKTTLKNCLKLPKNNFESGKISCDLLEAFVQLCQTIYPEQTGQEDILSDISLIHEMLFSHSELLDVMLSNNDVKTKVLKVIFVLSNKNKNVMSDKHVPLFLGAYSATLNTNDRLILNLLQFYETSGISLYNYRPYLWGEFAVNHYSVKGNVEMALLRQPTMGQVLELLNNEIIQNTIANFDISRKFQDDLSVDAFLNVTVNETCAILFNEQKSKKNEMQKVKSTLAKNMRFFYSPRNNEHGAVYDPCFYLPLFNHLLAPESVVQSYKFTQSGALALTLLALASECPVVRQAAFLVLSRFYFHLEGHTGGSKDRRIWLQLIDIVRRGLVDLSEDKELNVRIPCISAVFLARSTIILTQPLNPLYTAISNFLAVKDTFNFSTIPELLQLFHSANVDYVIHRTWILEILRDSLKTDLDVILMLKSVAYKFLTDFASSVLCSRYNKLLILQILRVSLPKAINFLLNNFGLISWLDGFVLNLTTETELIVEIIYVLNKLWLVLNETNSGDVSVARKVMKIFLKLTYILPKNLNSKHYAVFIETFKNVYEKSGLMFSKDCIEYLIDYSSKVLGDNNCKYILDYGNEIANKLFVTEWQIIDKNNDVNIAQNNLRQIVISWLKLNGNL